MEIFVVFYTYYPLASCISSFKKVFFRMRYEEMLSSAHDISIRVMNSHCPYLHKIKQIKTLAWTERMKMTPAIIPNKDTIHN